MRFAQFLCNAMKGERFSERINQKRKREVLCLARSTRKEKHFAEMFSLLSGFSGWNGKTEAEEGRSVPAGRLFELHSDRLAWIGDFNPLAVGFPAFGDDLNENFSERGVRNMGHAFAIGFDV